MEFLNVLSREEMKNVKGGGCGNIYCMVGGVQTWQGSGCGPDEHGQTPMDYALGFCVLEEEIGGGECGGCGQFPELE